MRKRKWTNKVSKVTIISCGDTVNLSLLGFFVFSGDGVIKIWDRDKTLLREIMMNETLTVASFLNTRGTAIVTMNKIHFYIDWLRIITDYLLSVFRGYFNRI